MHETERTIKGEHDSDKRAAMHCSGLNKGHSENTEAEENQCQTQIVRTVVQET